MVSNKKDLCIIIKVSPELKAELLYSILEIIGKSGIKTEIDSEKP